MKATTGWRELKPVAHFVRSWQAARPGRCSSEHAACGLSCMLNLRTRFGRQIEGWWLVFPWLFLLIAPPLPAADIRLPSLKIGTDVFTNVTVYQVTQTDIFVRHERGFGNAKISNLDDATLLLLGLKSMNTPESTGDASASDAKGVEKLRATLKAQKVKLPPAAAAALESLSRIKPTPQILYGVLAGAVIAYLSCCLCLRKVCVNAGSQPGLLVWIPILQLLPLVRAAKMPVWWFVIFLIPGLNFLAYILWSVRIVQVCGKGMMVALLLILPVTNLFALLYLAFSNGRERPAERTLKPEDLPGLAGA